jgi:hypothetical protein
MAAGVGPYGVVGRGRALHPAVGVVSEYGSLFDQHQALLRASAIPGDLARERGYVSVDTKKRLEGLGFSQQQRRVPGLLIPVWDERGQVPLYQYRPDSPRRTDAGKAVKYETLARARMVVDVPPRVRDRLGDPKVPLWLTEGVRKADSAVAAGLCCRALLGVWNWRGANTEGGKVALAFWESVALNERQAFIAFDSDVMLNRTVHDALVRLGAFLQRRGARVAYVYLPTGPGGAKVGLDDYLAAGGTVDGLVKLASAEPLSKPLLDEDAPNAAASPGEPEMSGKVPEHRPPRRRTLAEVETTWGNYLAGDDKDDLVPLHAVLATYAANLHLDGDPVWLMLVAGSSGGKTEHATSLARLPKVALRSTITGEAALLSGTSSKERAEHATGGLLREVGSQGLLILKDFTTILSLHRETRAQVLAALREVYDGKWSRSVGTDGGQTLEWSGKLGLVACCTSVLDQAHGVIATMGDRYIILRLSPTGRRERGRRALAHAGREAGMRKELADAVAGLFADGRPADPHELDDKVTERLVTLADLVTLARSPIARDFSGEVNLVLDPEQPTRLVKQLASLYRAAGAVGLDRATSWALVLRVGMDSIPQLRRRALEHLAGKGQASTTAVAAAIAHPTKTTKRALEDLAAHGVLIRTAQGQGRADLWELEPEMAEAWSVVQAPAGTLPDISGSPPSDGDATSNGDASNARTGQLLEADGEVPGSGQRAFVCDRCGARRIAIVDMAGLPHPECGGRFRAAEPQEVER